MLTTNQKQELQIKLQEMSNKVIIERDNILRVNNSTFKLPRVNNRNTTVFSKKVSSR